MISPLTKLREELTKNKLDAILISSVSNIIYLTNYSGFSKEEREAYLLIMAQPQGLTHKTPGVLGYILTDGRYSEAVKTLIPDFKLTEISSKNSFEKVIKQLIRKHRIKRMGFEGNNLTFLEHKNFSRRFNDLPRRPLRREASKAGLNHFSLNNLRIIKDEEEILAIEKACELGDKTFKYILQKIKLGVSEKELANEIEFFIKKQGGDISFKPIVAFGKNSAIPHHVPTYNKLTNNQIVLLDFGVKLNNYCSDMTRTIFFGKPSTEQKRMYETVLEAQQKAIQQFSNLTMQQSKIKASEIDKIARDYIISKGYPTIPHGLGHGIGIDVHEAPRLSPKSKDVLKQGMVFSIEPGIYLPAEASAKEGIPAGGVRIEDLVVLEKSGLRILTQSFRHLLTIK